MFIFNIQIHKKDKPWIPLWAAVELLPIALRSLDIVLIFP